MALAVPVAVRFLQRGNKELCRNMSSYLSLAAISNVDLLVDHTDAIVKSVLQGMKAFLLSAESWKTPSNRYIWSSSLCYRHIVFKP